MRCEKRGLFHCPINVAHLDAAGSAGQAGSASRPPFSFHEARFVEVQQEAADHHGVGIDGARKQSRRAEFIAAKGEHGHHVDGESKPAAFHATNLSAVLAFTSARRAELRQH